MSHQIEAVPASAEAQAGAVARNFAALASGEALARLLAFAATVYVARTLGASLYGVVGFAAAVTLYLAHVVDGGVESGLGVREVAATRRDAGTIVSSVLLVRLLVSLGAAALLAWGSLALLSPPDDVVLALYGLTLLAVGASSRWVHTAFGATGTVALWRTLGQVVVLVLILALVRGPGDLVWVPIAQFAGDALVAVGLLHRVRALGIPLPIRIEWPVVRPLLPRSGRLILNAMFGLMIFNADLLFLRAFRGTAEVGYYAAAYTLISFLLNVGMAYSLSFLASMTRLAAAPERQRELYHTAMAHVFAVGFPLALGGAVLAPEVIAAVFGRAYAPAGLPLQLLLWSIPLSLIRDVPIMGLMSQGLEGRVLRVTAFAAVLNIGLNAALVPPFGMVGAAAATLASELARMLLAMRYARLLGLAAAGPGRFWRAAAAGLAMGALIHVIGPSRVWLAVPAGAAGYLAVLAALGGIRLRRGELPVLRV